MFKVIGRHVPSPPGLRSPLEWGTADRLEELLGKGVSSMTVTPRTFTFRYRSPRHWLDAFSTQYGPMVKAFEALETAGKAALDAELLGLAMSHNTSTTGTLRVPSEYVEALAVRSTRSG